GIGHCRVHPHRPAAVQPKSFSLQPAGSDGGTKRRLHLGEHAIVGDVPLHTKVRSAHLVHCPCCRQHPYHSRIGRVDIGKHHVRSGREFRRDHCQVRET